MGCSGTQTHTLFAGWVWDGWNGYGTVGMGMGRMSHGFPERLDVLGTDKLLINQLWYARNVCDCRNLLNQS